MDDLLRLEDLGEPIETLVRDLDDADIEGQRTVATGLGVAPREGVEDGGLAACGESDDGDLHVGRVAGSGDEPAAAVSSRLPDPRRCAGARRARTGRGCRRTGRCFGPAPS